ncbi:MAG: hypothetical protein WKF84_10190, partial [Pyrinomonadaceae bacterium]
MAAKPRPFDAARSPGKTSWSRWKYFAKTAATKKKPPKSDDEANQLRSSGRCADGPTRDQAIR